MKHFLLILVGISIGTLTVSAEERSKEDALYSVTKYIRTTEVNGLPLHEEISKEEYELSEPSLAMTRGYNYAETSWKKFELNTWVEGANHYNVVAELTWKVIPTTKSYDVLGLRLVGDGEIQSNTIAGRQTYIENGVQDYIDYSYNGTNTKILSNGYGTSMNLVNGGTAYLMVTEAYINTTSSNNLVIYGAYQHATRDVTLAQSQNYILNGGGFGAVFMFNDGVGNSYDMMPGAHITLER